MLSTTVHMIVPVIVLRNSEVVSVHLCISVSVVSVLHEKTTDGEQKDLTRLERGDWTSLHIRSNVSIPRMTISAP